MSIPQILALTALAALLGLLRRGRGLGLLGFGALVIYLLQPSSLVFPSLSFWLPTLTLFITVLVWTVAAPPEARTLRDNWPALTILAGEILLAAFASHLPFEWAKSLPEAPSIVVVGAALVVFTVVGGGLSILRGGNRLLPALAALGLLAIFIFLKSPWLSERLLTLAAEWRGRTNAFPAGFSIAWLGYSYIAFRLLHTIRDRQEGNLPAVGLAEYVNYVIFFPSFTAGPIDRLERFIRELRAPLPLKNEDWLWAGQRLTLGLFKKFFVADLLARVSITEALVYQTRGAGWLWFVLCAYSLRIYFDFSGYTDIAIGMARLMGVRLPENFASPFLKPNLTQFWNSWHMTLTQWFRTYFFNPFTRRLRTSSWALPPGLIVLPAQVLTMLLIGLWHGITWNYALWGLWHGLGLFIQNRWSEFVRVRFPNLGRTSFSRTFFYISGVLATFGYFTLGLVFFALPTPWVSLAAFMKLFGIS